MDARGRDHRNRRGEKQHRLDRALANDARAPARQPLTDRQAGGQYGAQCAASRLSSSSIVMPTSAMPPNTVPFLPFTTCCHAWVYALAGSGTYFTSFDSLAPFFM